MKHRRFRYFSDVKRAERFLEGEMECSNAAFFRDYEDHKAQQVKGDEYECTRLYRPSEGLKIEGVSHSFSSVLNAGVEFITKARDIYIFCYSNSYSDELIKEFEASTVIEIFNPREFIQRWKRALPLEAQKEGRHVAANVKYYKREEVPGNVWAQPHLITISKLKQFEYQDEYRLAFTETHAFNFQNLTMQIVDRKTRPSPQKHEHDMKVLQLGSLHDICRRVM